ncbi:MAG: PDZ domain-containing protein [Gammaproteobacteria bacterium]|nr:MAG: PDZ domain-containing protein [Gammaproteobacteria bacterium]
MGIDLRFLLQAVLAGLLLGTLWLLHLERERNAAPPSYADAVARAAPAVVNIYTSRRAREIDHPLAGTRLYRLLRPRRPQTSLGSGVIVRDDGIILTNAHLIEGAEEILVALQDGRSARAGIVGVDPDTDLAVLRIDLEPLPRLTISEGQRLRVGDVVLAIGNPFGVGQTVTFGIVSATGRNRLGINTYEDFIQTDAAINPGNSGGALVNARGELIGINTAIFQNGAGSQGISFAIPMSIASHVLDQIVRYGAVVRGWLGVELRDLPPGTGTSGVLVSGVVPDGPAALAGLRPGDILTEIGGEPLREGPQAITLISRLEPGSTVDLEVLRQGRRVRLQAGVGRRPNYRPRPR